MTRQARCAVRRGWLWGAGRRRRGGRGPCGGSPWGREARGFWGGEGWVRQDRWIGGWCFVGLLLWGCETSVLDDERRHSRALVLMCPTVWVRLDSGDGTGSSWGIPKISSAAANTRACSCRQVKRGGWVQVCQGRAAGCRLRGGCASNSRSGRPVLSTASSMLIPERVCEKRPEDLGQRKRKMSTPKASAPFPGQRRSWSGALVRRYKRLAYCCF